MITMETFIGFDNYISKITDSEFTTKDFRTCVGTDSAIVVFNEHGSIKATIERNLKIPVALTWSLNNWETPEPFVKTTMYIRL
jgi:hypothetical protein